MSPICDREIVNGDGRDEFLQAQAHIWNHIFNFISSMSLKCAVQLGIPDIIHNHPHKSITLFELIKALQIPQNKSSYVYRLMRILVHSGFFAIQKIYETQEESYLLTPSSKLLLKDHPYGMSSYVLVVLDPVVVTPFHFISDWFQSSDELITTFEATHGTSFWQYCGENQQFRKLFDESMACDTLLAMSVVLKECKVKFDGVKSLVDVGGGTGTVGRMIAETFPGIWCTVFDLPQVIGTMQGSKNVEFVSGDMFESIPSADVVLLKWIMHNWSDEKCVKILKRCREAIPSKENGGKVIIIDMVIEDEKNKGNYESTEAVLFFDIIMMNLVMGKERTKIEWEKLFLDAGFSSYNITPILGLRSFIEVFP